jgi:hypothetical protein
MKMRVGRLLIALVLLLPSGVRAVHALLDPNPKGYVDDLSWMPTPEQQNNAPQGIMNGIFTQTQAVYAAGLTVAGFTFLYIVNAAFRDKVHTWLGLKAKNDAQETPAA